MVVTKQAITLAKGSHRTASPPSGDEPCEVCFWEAFNLLITPPNATPFITDDCPSDVSRVLHRFGVNLNDALPNDLRQDLKALLPNGGPSPLSGTRDDGLDEQRDYLALDWLIRIYTPTWLDLAGLPDEARTLRDLRRIVDSFAAQSAEPIVRTVRIAAWRKKPAAVNIAVNIAAVADVAADAADADVVNIAAVVVNIAANIAANIGDVAAAAQLQRSAIDLFYRMITPIENE